MSNGNPSESRLDRLEALAEVVLQGIQQNGVQISELRETIDRNGAQISELRGTISSNGEQIAALRETVAQESEQIAELREGIADVVSLITQQAEEQGARHVESEQRFENLLQDARADRQQAERDRALNESEHRAFRETFQTLLAEVARIWQRLAG